MAEKKNVGYSPEDFKRSYGKYYDETIEELAPQVQHAFKKTPFPAGALLVFNKIRHKPYHSSLF